MKIVNNKSRLSPGRNISPSIFISEGRYFVKIIDNKHERARAHKLRHMIFCQELGWVPGNSNSLEIDDYDDNAVFFGVYDEHQNLMAFLRAVLAHHTFMSEKEFTSLFTHLYCIRKEFDTVEISRLCVAREARNVKSESNFGAHSISMILYKGVYQWCIKNSIRYLYLVVEEKFFRLLCASGFPCKLVGTPRVMSGGVTSVAAMMDWREFEETNQIMRPKMVEWFRHNQLNLPPMRLQRHESC